MNSKKTFISLVSLLISIPVIALIAGSIVNFITTKTNYSNIIAFVGAIIAAILLTIILSICKIKNIIIAIIYSFLIGCSVYTVHIYGDYISFGKQIAVEQNLTNVTNTKALADEVLKAEIGEDGLVGYAKYVAKAGIIAKSGRMHRITKHEGADAWMEMTFDFLSYVAVTVGCGYYYVNDKRKEKSEKLTENA